MLEVWIELSEVNVELLDAELRAVGDNLFYGLSAQRGGVTLYMSDKASDELRDQLAKTAEAHDATQLTPQQQEALERHYQLEQGRDEAELDLAPYAESSVSIQMLAHKIAWLEQEMRDLRGL